MVGVGEAIGKGGGSGTLLTREAGADFFCSSTCIDFYEQTLRNGFKISIPRNNNNAPPRLLVPLPEVPLQPLTFHGVQVEVEA